MVYNKTKNNKNRRQKMNNKIIDTLIIERNGHYMIESYQGQDLDNYDHDVELNHNELLYCKEQDRYFMKDNRKTKKT